MASHENVNREHISDIITDNIFCFPENLNKDNDLSPILANVFSSKNLIPEHNPGCDHICLADEFAVAN